MRHPSRAGAAGPRRYPQPRRRAGTATCRSWDSIAYTVAITATAMTVAVALAGCLPVPPVPPFEAVDLRPPAVVAWGASGPATVAIRFDEGLAEALPDFSATPGFEAVSAEVDGDGTTVLVSLDAQTVPGAPYAVSGTVADAAGNRSSFVLPFWGFNPNPAGLVINELLTEGSSTHPDAVEFAVVADGDCAGLTFYVGHPADRELRYVFPPLEAKAGDFVVLHLKPQGLASELDERADKAASGGLDASAAAWDLWYREAGGALSGANGLLTLFMTPGGTLADAVAYSERFSDSDEKYGGFGTAAFRDRVAYAAAAGAWATSSPPKPEDCARSTGSTSTRTICRSSVSADADSAADWHVVPTKGATLGAPNSDEVYAP